MDKLNEKSARSLADAALKAMRHAYAPYSRFPVGAALLCGDGSVFTGCNVENASFPAGICAERVALGKAVSEGCREFTAIAVAAAGDSYCTPCGICRQSLAEFSKGLPVLCCNGHGQYRIYTMDGLLPHAFDADFPDKK